ncbi:MAG: 50S ribosomal protein L3 [Candidatus Saccharimonadales bacterium]
MKAIIGRKLGMTQIFTEDSNAKAVTLVEAGPCSVTAIRSDDKDGYEAIQLGYGEAKNLNKPQQGHQKSAKTSHSYLREFKSGSEVKVGDKIDVSAFEVGDEVRVSGISKGKGFSGVIKRHNFSRGPMSHGSQSKRKPGSIGSMYPQKVFKGKKMAGRMGNEKVTVKGLKIEAIDTTDNLLAISGAIPGKRGNLVVIQGKEE